MSVTSRRAAYIAVHGGAGVHSVARENEVKYTLKLACKQALGGLTEDASSRIGSDRNGTALDMVGNAIAILEDDPCFNAGYGSNLTLRGTVECDAAIMDSHSGDFGSVGAVSGVKNPIRLARAILEYSKIPEPFGRIPPLTLVSEGARSFATDDTNIARYEIEIVDPESLVSPRAKEDWLKWNTRLGNTTEEPMELPSLTDVQDTVGGVAAHWQGAIAAGVSSGGILLKYPGRLGEAAVFGAGCWAQRFPEAGLHIACSISGTGEYISRVMLAHTIAESFDLAISTTGDADAHEILHRVLLEKFWLPCITRGINNPDVGVLLLTIERLEEVANVHLWCAFTTPSMAIAYASTINPKPKVQILRRPKNMASSSAGKSHIFITAIPL